MTIVPPGRQCSFPDCEREASNPQQAGSLCSPCLDRIEEKTTARPEKTDGQAACLDEDTIQEHYNRVRDVLEPLGHLGEFPTIATNDKWGWYVTRDNIHVEDLEAGYDKRRRPVRFNEDYDTLASRVERTLYAITSYKDERAARRWRACRYDENGNWEYKGADNATPPAESIRAISAWGDIDLADDLKPKRNDLDEKTKAIAEQALEAYVDEVAALYGGLDAVYLLDSVGGAYIFGAPEATAPIIEYFDEPEDRARVIDAFIERSNTWLEEAEERVNERVDGAADVIDPDWANNINRMYKAPLSLHGDHDAVVTPVDVEDVTYEFTPIGDVDDDLLAETQAWCEAFTRQEHTDSVAVLVEHLWPDEYDEHGDWQAALEAWLESQHTEERQSKQALKERENERDQHEIDLAGCQITPNIWDVYDALDELNIEAVADETIVHRWTDRADGYADRSADGHRALIPEWGKTAKSGNANYVNPGKGVWVDTANDDHGTAVELALIGSSRTSWRRGDIAAGEDWVRGVDELRRLEFDVPVWTPDANTGDYDRMPLWALRRAAVALDVCGRGDFVEKDGSDGGTYLDFPDHETRQAALSAVEEVGLEHGWDDSTGWTREAQNPLELDAVLEPELAWRAARSVSPADLEADVEHDLPTAGNSWTCPHCDEEIDIVRAVALDRGAVDACDEPLRNRDYDDAYRRARREYGAPLPEYVDAATATDNWAVIKSTVAQLEHWHLSTVKSRVTGLGGSDEDVVAELNPCWEFSGSGTRLIAFQSGGFYCREHECGLDPLRFVALEAGIIDECDGALAGDDFKEAYHVAREEYGAPLPEWTVGHPEHIPILPPAEDLIDELTTDRSGLQQAREGVEQLYRELATDSSSAYVLTALPATGKTTAVVTSAAENPTLYLAARKELMAEMAAKANDRGRAWMHLPIFSETPPEKYAVREAATAAREQGLDLLAIDSDLETSVDGPIYPDGAHCQPADEDEDEVHLDRTSCATANGEHGEAWALRVHVARELGYTPRDIITKAEALFDEPLPCADDCSYSSAWDRATDPQAPKDLLIGHYGHGHVAGARTYYERENDRTHTEPRTIAIDEFPGDVFDQSFGEEFLDHATWLARALCDDVDDRQRLLEQRRELWEDEWIRAWLAGHAAEEIDAIEDLDRQLAVREHLLEATEAASTALNLDGTRAEGDESPALLDALTHLINLGPEYPVDEIERVFNGLCGAVNEGNTHTSQVLRRVDEDILGPLTAAMTALEDDDDLAEVDLPEVVSGDLARMVTSAAEAFCERRDGAAGLLQATRTALDGGEEGCRELAVHARDGYAHPLAYLLLHGVLAGDDRAAEIPTNAFTFDTESSTGTNLKQVRLERSTVLVDRNHHGALVRQPPEFHDRDGFTNPVVGLDATGRERLWQLALGQDITTRDIHETVRERRAFLKEVLNLQIVQTSPHINSYSGSPAGKNFDGDVALVQAVAGEYGGTDYAITRQRRIVDRQLQVTTTKPGVITTKKARREIEDRIEDDIGAIDHYSNVAGSNALAEHNVAIILGCQHFGDTEVEKWAALAGETVTRSGKGVDLDYGSETANTFLKHMREDQAFQAILRFGRDEEGAVVFAHTAALREDLPIVGDGTVVRAFSQSAQEIGPVIQRFPGRQFTVSDVVDEGVSCSKRTVQRILKEWSQLGYLNRHDPGPGRANKFEMLEEPGPGEVDLPDLEQKAGPTEPGEKPRQSPLEVYYTRSVGVTTEDGGGKRPERACHTTLPAPSPQARASVGDDPPPDNPV